MPMPLQKGFDIAQETQNNGFPFLAVLSVKIEVFFNVIATSNKQCDDKQGACGGIA
jgi:hypothetical protein